MNINFFYAYDKRLKDYLFKNGFRFNCTGYNVKTQDQFWQYTQTPELMHVMDQYNGILQQLKTVSKLS